MNGESEKLVKDGSWGSTNFKDVWRQMISKREREEETRDTVGKAGEAGIRKAKGEVSRSKEKVTVLLLTRVLGLLGQ